MPPQAPFKIPKVIVDSVNTAVLRCIAREFGINGRENKKELEIKRQRWFRDVGTPEFKAAVEQAVRDKDAGFFKRMGRVLSQPPKPLPDPLPSLAKKATVHSALILLWLPGDQPSAGFCQMSDPLIAKCLHVLLNLGKNGLEPNTVRQTWKRLGLKKVTTGLLTCKSKLPAGARDLPPWGPDELIRPTPTSGTP
jgi:hypothetical protein